MNETDPQLLTAVRERIDIGYPYEKINVELAEAGYSDEEIKAVYTECSVPIPQETASEIAPPPQVEVEAPVTKTQSEPKKHKHNVLGVILGIIGVLLIVSIIIGTFWIMSGHTLPFIE